MKFFIAVIFVLSGILFAQESIPHVNFHQPIVYEAGTDVDVGVSASHKGKGFNYQLVLATVGVAVSYLGFLDAIDYDSKAEELLKDPDFSSKAAYLSQREKIQDYDSRRNTEAIVASAFFAASVFFLVSYILD